MSPVCSGEQKAAEEGQDPATEAKHDGPEEMTLDEWKAQQKRMKQEFNIRRPGEGCDDSQWKKTYVLKKKTPEEEEEESDEEEEVSAVCVCVCVC